MAHRRIRTWKAQVRARARAVRLWSHRRIPAGLRLILGLVLIAGGILGFLPVLGFWMIPLGMAVAAADVVPLRRWWRGRKDKAGTGREG